LAVRAKTQILVGFCMGRPIILRERNPAFSSLYGREVGIWKDAHG